MLLGQKQGLQLGSERRDGVWSAAQKGIDLQISWEVIVIGLVPCASRGRNPWEYIAGIFGLR